MVAGYRLENGMYAMIDGRIGVVYSDTDSPSGFALGPILGAPQPFDFIPVAEVPFGAIVDGEEMLNITMYFVATASEQEVTLLGLKETSPKLIRKPVCFFLLTTETFKVFEQVMSELGFMPDSPARQVVFYRLFLREYAEGRRRFAASLVMS